MSISQEQRRHLRERISEARSGQSLGQVISWDDIEALLDLADERDRYRALLGQCREVARAAINSGDWVVDGARDPDMVFDRIDAALEGKTND